MNTQIYNSENVAPKGKKKNKNKIDTSEYNLTKEEIAESVINSLNNAQKYLRGEIKLQPARELIEELKQYVEKEKKNGKDWNLWSFAWPWFFKKSQ